MAIKKTDPKNKGRTSNFIPYDPNTDEERSPASSYLPPTPTPVKKPIEEASYEAERKVETAKPTPPPAPPYDQPPSFSPPERLDKPVETYSPDTADQPPSLNVRQYEYAKEARGDQPPSFSIPKPAPLPVFDDTSEPTNQDIEDLNRAKKSYNEQAEKIAKETQDFNRLVDEQTFRVDALNEIAEEIQKEIGEPPVNVSEVSRREAQLIAQQNDLDDRYNIFASNPYGDINEQGYYIDAENMIAEQDLINEELDSIFEKYKSYNDWVNASNQPSIKGLTNQYEIKLNQLNDLNSVISQKGFELNQDIENSSRLYDVLDIRENELVSFSRDMENQYKKIKEIEKAKKSAQIDPLITSERNVESLNLVYLPLSQRETNFFYDPTAIKGEKIKEVLKPEIFQRPDFDLEFPNFEYNFQTPDPLSEIQETQFEPDTFFSRNPIDVTTGDLIKLSPIGGVSDLLSSKINEIEDKSLNWVDKNLGKIELGGVIQDSIYHITKEGNKAIYSANRILKNEQDVENFIADVRKAQTEAERIRALGDWGESAFSPQAGTIVEFLDIPYYYNQVKKLDDIRLFKFDGNKNTDVTDIDDYILAIGTLGGLTLKDRGIRTPDIGYIDDLLELQGRVLTKYIGQSPETYRTADFWLSSPLAELPKHDPIKALRREDDFIERAVLGDVLFPSAETGRVLERFEDENGNPPKDFSWGIKKANNWLGFEVDEKAIESERYKELLPYLQARAQDDYIRPLDLIFTVAEVSTAFPTARFLGKLAVRPIKNVYKSLPTSKRFRTDILNQSNNTKQLNLLASTPDKKLKGDELAIKKLYEIDKANKKIAKLEKNQIINEENLELLKLPTKTKTGNLKNWLGLNLVPIKFYENSFNNVQNHIDNYTRLINKNSLEGQLEELNSKSLLSAQDIERRDFILFLQDQEIDQEYINNAVKELETPKAKELRKQTELLANYKKYHDTASTALAGSNPAPDDVNLLSAKIQDFGERPIAFSKLPNSYDPKNKYYNLENIAIATRKINEIFEDKNLSLGEQSDNLAMIYDDLNKLNPELVRNLELDSFYNKLEAYKKNDMDAVTFEDLKIGWQTERKKRLNLPLKNIETIRNSNKTFSPQLKKGLDDTSSFFTKSLLAFRRNPLKRIMDPDKSTVKAEQALIGEKIVLPRSFVDAEKINDGTRFEEKQISKKLDQDARKGATGDLGKSIRAPKILPFDVPQVASEIVPPINQPDTMRVQDPQKLRDPERLKEPDTKRTNEPDAQTSKKVEDAETKKIKESEIKKKKKTKDPKKLKEPKKIKEPDAKKKKKKRIKNKDTSIPPTGEVDQDVTRKQIKKDFPAVIQWKDGEKYYTYNLNTNETQEREFPILGGVKAGDTPEKSVKIIRRSSTRPKFFKKKIGNLSLQIKSPTVVTVKKLENNLYNKTKPINFRN